VPTPADTLRHAALYLTRHGWIQDDYLASVPDATNPFPPACAYGAIAAAANGTPVTAPRQQQGETRRAFALALDVFDGYLTEQLGPDQDGNEQSGAEWNDDDGRTATEVIAALNAAADRYEHTHRYLAAYAAKTVPGGAR
jgi:hypothetical protein